MTAADRSPGPRTPTPSSPRPPTGAPARHQPRQLRSTRHISGVIQGGRVPLLFLPIAVLAAEPSAPATSTSTGTPATSTTAPTSPPPSSVIYLTGSNAGWLLATVVGFVLLAGFVVVGGRRLLLPGSRAGRLLSSKNASGDNKGRSNRGSTHDSDRTVVRSWLAISLVGGLLIFVAASFWLDDSTLRSTLVGGLVANAGAAVAFYFASRASDE